MALFVVCAWLVLWPDHSLVVNNPGTKSKTVLYPICGVIMWPVMACCVDYFLGISYATTSVGISYATTGLEDHVFIA